MINDTTIGINKKLLKRLKLVAVYSDKKLYEIIDEAATTLEEKYHVPHKHMQEQTHQQTPQYFVYVYLLLVYRSLFFLPFFELDFKTCITRLPRITSTIS